MFKEIGAKIFPEIGNAKVVASNDINEESIIDLNKNVKMMKFCLFIL